MSKTIEQLRAEASQIEEATRQGENTQIRVGGLFQDIIDFIGQIPVTETVLGPLLTALNNSELINPGDGQTLTFSLMKEGWTFSDALTQLQIKLGQITSTVTSNYEAFIQVKDQLQREVDATDQRVREYKTEYDQSQIEYATWKSQTDTSISQYATAINKVTGDIISISGRVDTAYDQLDFVTNDLEAADKAIGKIFDLAGMNLSDEPSASWLYRNKDGIYGAAATFDAEGNIKNLSKLQVTIDGINTEVSDVKGNMSYITQTVDTISQTVRSYDGRISEISQTADAINARVTDLSGKYSNLKLDVNSISATVYDTEKGLGAVYVTANSAINRVETLEGTVAEMGVKVITVDNIQRTLATIKANILDFDFTDVWTVSSNGKEVMRLNTNGDLSISGKLYGEIVNGTVIGTGVKNMYIEGLSDGARLVGKDDGEVVLSLGFNNIGEGAMYKPSLLLGRSTISEQYMQLRRDEEHYLRTVDCDVATVTPGFEVYEAKSGYSSGNYVTTLILGLYKGKVYIKTYGTMDIAWPTREEAEINQLYLGDEETIRVKTSY